MRYCSVLVLAALLSVSAAQTGFAAAVKFTPTNGIEFVETRIDDHSLYATVLNSGDVAFKAISFVCDFFNVNTPVGNKAANIMPLKSGGRATVQFYKPRKHDFDAIECRVSSILR